MTKRLNTSKGITLIALVITIIVLLILAGVAIAMLSGENGILRKAAESKTKTEEGQKEEMGSLLSYEMALNTDSGYKYQHGCITGFEYDKENKRTVESVKDLEDKLPKGYKIITKYNYATKQDEIIKDEDKDNTYISTGMTVQKDGQEVARTVLFGDINGDGEIGLQDSTCLKRIVGFYYLLSDFEDFQKMAMNLYNDNELNIKDLSQLSGIVTVNPLTKPINQKESKKFSGKDLKRFYTELQEYIKSLDTSSGYSFEYNSEQDTYKLKGVKNDTTVGTLINVLPTSKEVTIVDKDKKGLSNDSKVVDGGYVQIKFKEDETEILCNFACIELEK